MRGAPLGTAPGRTRAEVLRCFPGRRAVATVAARSAAFESARSVLGESTGFHHEG